MEKKKIAVIGVGGRTGTMFAFELAKYSEILGVAREEELKLIKEGRLYVEREDDISELFEQKVTKDTDFYREAKADIIFLATKNPVSVPIRYYLKGFKSEIPSLLVSQNGISALSDSKKTLRDMFGEKSKNIRVVRIVLFNPIDKRESGGKVCIKYSLPIRVAFAKYSGPGEIKDIIEIFKKAGFKVKEFPSKDANNLEFSKLFLNLIGMASAARGLSIEDGFSDKEIFKEEVEAMREYIKTVKLAGGDFLNFPDYPVKFFANLILFLPFSLLFAFRNVLINKINKGREGKPKDLDEIDYYNGAVVSLGKKIGVKTPINEMIYRRAVEKLK